MRIKVRDVLRWKNDLSAQIEREPETSHLEISYQTLCGGGNCDDPLGFPERVIDSPGVWEPNIPKRARARRFLERAYNESPSATVAYLAGRAIGKNPADLREELGEAAPLQAFVVEHPLVTLAAVGTLAYGIYSWVSQFS